METQFPRFYEFGEFKIDSRRRILTKNNDEIHISAKNFELLLFLLQNEGRILSHNELLDSVWEGTFVEQSNLKKGISALRQILGETPDSSLYIKTIPRKGYSFVSPVRAYTDEERIHVTATEVFIEEEIIEDDEPIEPAKILPAEKSQAAFWTKYGKFILVSLLILSLGALFFAFRGYFYTKKGKRFSAESVKITKLTMDGNCSDASISADGNFILCGYKTDDGATLITRQIWANSQVQLLPPQKNISFWAYRITPDGNSVFYMLHDNIDGSKDGLYQIPFLGGTPRKINESALHITFSPDSKKIGFVRINPNENQILTANLDGSDEKIITTYKVGHRIWGLTWSPDGKTLLCSARLQTDENFIGFVDEISLDNGDKERVFENEKMVVSAAWMPDKTSIILGLKELNSDIRQIWQYFPSNKELLRVTNDNNIYRFPVLNQSGTIISVSQESNLSGIYVGESGSNEIKPITNENGYYGSLIKTNNDRLIYNAFEEGSEAIWIMNSDGSNKRKITDGKDGTSLQPILSSDQNSIVYTSMRSGKKELWRINLDGSGLTQLTKNPNETILDGKLLADNQTLILNSFSKDGAFLWKINPNGERKKLVENLSSVWDISPDDKLIVFHKYNSELKHSEIVVQSIETNQILQVIPMEINYILHWIDSNSYVYEIQDTNQIRIYKQTLDKNPPKLIFEQKGRSSDIIPSFEFLDTGKKFVLVRGKYLNDAVTIKIDDTK